MRLENEEMGGLEQMELKLVPEKTALVVIDLQKGVVGLNCAPYSSQEVVDRTLPLAEAFRAAGSFVVLVNVDFHDGKDALRPITDTPPRAMGERPKDYSAIVPELGPQGNDYLLTKKNWGAFYGTDMDLQLRRRGIDTIVLCGIATNIGVETTAREAFQHGYQQVFVSDAMTALSAEEHEFTLKYMLPRMGRVRTVEEVVAALK